MHEYPPQGGNFITLEVLDNGYMVYCFNLKMTSSRMLDSSDSELYILNNEKMKKYYRGILAHYFSKGRKGSFTS
jgi:hypothetical protein